MAPCSFDMQFTFVWAGWGGNAHDTRIFHEAIDSRIINFQKPPEGSDLLYVTNMLISVTLFFFVN